MADSFDPDDERTDEPRRGLRTEEIGARTVRRERVEAIIGPIDWTPPEPAAVDLLFSNFQVTELLGRGGMGAVYRAQQLSLERDVAIKLLPTELALDANFVRRFTREVKVMARLNHPRVVSIYEQGTTPEGQAYFVMEYVAGHTLHELLQQGALSLSQKMRIFHDICEGLAYAHRSQVVHRDMKPTNVLVDANGRAKIADFGMARLDLPDELGMTTNHLIGTPAYMAPEQLENRTVDNRTDIYALGVMLYELLCGEVPRGHMDPPSVRMGVDMRFDSAVAQAMHNQPDRRPSSVEALLAQLPAVPSESGRSRLLERLRPRTPAARYGLATVACVLVFLPAAGFWKRATKIREKVSGASASASAVRETIRPVATGSAIPVPNEEVSHTGGEEGWHDWIAEQKQNGGLPKELTQVPDANGGHLITNQPNAIFVLGPPSADQAVRITFSIPDKRTASGLQLMLRHNPTSLASYLVQAHTGEWRLVRQEGDGRKYTLASCSRQPIEFRSGLQQAEFIAHGTQLEFYLNGVLVCAESDSTFTNGVPRLRCVGDLNLHKVEWRSALAPR